MFRPPKKAEKSKSPGSIAGTDWMEIQRVTRHLNVEMVEEAYREGIFPMADVDLGIVTWHRPRRRAVLPLDAFHISRSLGRRLRRGGFAVTFDRDFGGVMAACAEGRPAWISAEFQTV
jgi:leucyl/phenylalanyl-tRNA--protein transferase